MRKEIIRDIGKSGRKKIENTGGGEIRELTLLTLLSDSARDTVLRKTVNLGFYFAEKKVNIDFNYINNILSPRGCVF